MLGFSMLSPPFVSYNSDNGKRCQGKINNAGIQSLCGLCTHLFRGAGTDRALRVRVEGKSCKQDEEKIPAKIFHEGQM